MASEDGSGSIADHTGGQPEPIPVPDWYAQHLAGTVSIEDLLRERFDRRWLARARRCPLLWAVLAYATTRRASRVALVKGHPGSRRFMWLEGLLGGGRKRLILLHFIAREPPPGRLAAAAVELRQRLLERPFVRRSMLRGQVLTEAERRTYSSLYGIPIGRLALVRWPLLRYRAQTPRVAEATMGVSASGRAHCDWETLFAAAAGREWPLTVICGAADEERVRRLAAERPGAQVFCELSRERHDRMIGQSAVYVLPLRTTRASAGHVRLMAAFGAGVPVVAPRVPTLEGYAEESTTVGFEAGDPASLRSAIELLLGDPERRRRLRSAALERAHERTYPDYFAAIGRLITDP